jgi:pimeloyl-ACP methyl ester carboxylesterase
MLYRFGDYALDLQTYTLRRGEEEIAVEPQVFGILACLIENRDRLVTKDELIESVWDGRIISDATLSSRISLARQAVGDSGDSQAVIRTVPRRGFRFVAEVSADSPPSAPAPPAATTGPVVRYCVAPDGVQLAYASCGSGPPLVKVANWINHLDFDWQSPIWCGIFQAISTYRTLVRYDSRGVGLSDWAVEDFSFAALASDLTTVIDATRPERFALLGISQGAAVAIDYAVRHPERVSHLILWGGFARGRLNRGNPEDAAQSEAFRTILRQGWGKEESTFRKMFAALYLPEAGDEHVRWWTEMQRVATSGENAVRLRDSIDRIDVSILLPQVRTPTLILHSAREAVAPLAEARFMAARIPNAAFVLLDSANHLVLEHEPAWTRALDCIREFLGERDEAAKRP